MNKRRSTFIWSIIIGVTAIALVAVAFGFFVSDNNQRIQRENTEYVLERTRIVTQLMDEKVASGRQSAAALAKLYGGGLEAAGPDPDGLKALSEDSSAFDAIAFIDGSGVRHEPDGTQTACPDEPYYTDGMAGNAGLQVVFDPADADGTQLVYYAPVYVGKETAGVMLGITHASDLISGIFDVEYFNEPVSFCVALPDGSVIAADKAPEGIDAPVLNDFTEKNADLQAAAAAPGEPSVFEYDKEYAYAGLSRLSNADWTLLTLYPSAAHGFLVRNANASGAKLGSMLIAIFTAVGILQFLFFARERRVIENTSNERGTYKRAILNDAMIALEINLTKNRLTDGLWRDKEHRTLDLHTILNIDMPCNYDTYIVMWNHKFVEAVSNAQFETMTSRRYLLDAFNSGKNEITFDYEAKNPGGGKAFLRRTISMTADEATGDIIAYTNVKDVTEIVRKEMEQKNMIREALMRAESANRAKTIFLSNMSHDIRTPMNAILGFTTLAESHADNEEAVRGYLEKIMFSGKHLLSLINDVLDMSRIESGKMHLDETDCNLSELIRELKSILMGEVKAKGLGFSIDTGRITEENVLCDKLRLSQVILNLLSNAIKYTEPGGKIGLYMDQLEGDTPDRPLYEFRVTDTGMGMSPEFVAHLFEPFERERNTTISGIQGTGLGMAITKNIIDLMEGGITVTSEVGKGSEFTVRLPLKKAPDMPDELSVEEWRDVPALIVDDDFDICDSVSAMASRFGLKADWTLSGNEALMRAMQASQHGAPYGIYFIDWVMPEMSGIELVKKLRSSGITAPIVVLTAYDWSDIEKEATAAGVTSFVAKPMFPTDFKRCLVRLCRDGQVQESAAPVIEVRRSVAGSRVLLVEDNELNREIATEILTESDFIVEAAENGQIALDTLLAKGAGYYQAVLMDIQMPVMDGYTAAKNIRAFEDPALASVPIIAMTANAFAEDKKMALDCGMNAHVAKPISVKILLDTLEKLI